METEFSSPTKTRYIFKRDSLESHDSGLRTPKRGHSPIRKSISSVIAGLVPRSPHKFDGSREDVQSRNSFASTANAIPYGVDNASIKDFADTSSEDDDEDGTTFAGASGVQDYDSESVESILQEYTKASPDAKTKKFVFKEHFDEASLQRNRSVRSTIGRSLNSDFNSSAEFDIFHDAAAIPSQEKAASPTGTKNSRSSGSRTTGSRNSGSRHSGSIKSASPRVSQNRVSVSMVDSVTFDTTTSERPLYDLTNFKYSMVSLNSGELLTKLERSLTEWSDDKDKAREVVVARSEQSPKLVNVVQTSNPSSARASPAAPTSTVPRPPLKTPEQAHYHDSDISSNNSIGSIDYKTSGPNSPNPANNVATNSGNKASNSPNTTHSSNKSSPPLTARRPPPSVPQDSLEKANQHEAMVDHSKVVSGFPTLGSRVSGMSTIHDSDDGSSPIYSYNITSSTTDVFDKPEEKYKDTSNYFGWWYFGLFVILGLLLPPIFFLLPLGSFDKIVKSGSSSYNGVYYHQQYIVSNSRIVRFSRRQKALSLVLGLFWSAVIFSMIGVGFGLTQ